MFWFNQTFDFAWLYRAHTYDWFDVGFLEGSGITLALILATGAVGAAFLVLVPRRHNVMSTVGRFSLYPYLLHGFVVLGLAWSGALRTLHGVTGTLIVGVAVVLLVLVLSSPPLRWVTRPFVEPRVDALLVAAR
jgi:fucose 4-O-acetylase-like acetyltransferase